MYQDRFSADKVFRSDINGLRAVAVILVVLFHMGLKDWKGGFVGVDVFFVISGFLIIPKIFEQIDNGFFSLSSFLQARLRRLMPAVIPVLIYVFVFSFLFMGDYAFRDVLQSILYQMFFLSNIFYSYKDNYFDQSGEMLMLHGWSLSVEFQFYTLSAIFIIIFKKHKNIIFYSLIILSFLYSLYLVKLESQHAYYIIFSRFWQLGLGGVLGIHQKLIQDFFKNIPSYASISVRFFGFSAIIYCSLKYSSATAFPGASALIPTLGTILIIAPGYNGSDFLVRALNLPFMQFFGRISYSLYLWHWPLLLSLNASMFFEKIEDFHKICAVSIALCFAYFSYRFLEEPAKNHNYWLKINYKNGLILLSAVFVFLVSVSGLTGSLLDKLRGFAPFQDARELNGLADAPRHAYLKNIRALGVDGKNGICSIDGNKSDYASFNCLSLLKGKRDILIIGDSHGRDMFIVLRGLFKDRNFHMIHRSSCAPVSYGKCFPGLSRVLEEIDRSNLYKGIVFVSHWPEKSLKPFSEMLRASPLKERSLIIGPSPVFAKAVTFLLKKNNHGYVSSVERNFRVNVDLAEKTLRNLAHEYQIPYVSRMDVLCPGENCPVFVPNSNDLIYFDDQHLTDAGMRFLGSQIRRYFEWHD